MHNPILTQENLLIRDFDGSDSDYAVTVRINNAIWHENPITVSQLKEWDAKRRPEFLFRRTLIEKDGVVVGAGAIMEQEWAHVVGKYRIEQQIHPDFQGQGIGRAWYQYACQFLKTRTPAPQWISTGVREDKLNAVAWVERLGFEAKMRFQVSEIDLTQFDPTQFADTIKQVQESGIQIYSLDELLASDPDCKRKIYELDLVLTEDVPFPDTFTMPDYDNYHERVFESQNFLPEGWRVAVDNGEYVGLTMLWKSQALPTKLYTGLTGVKREYRRRGIATAVKVLSLTYAKEVYGATLVETDNEENNPMYQLNVQLGFHPIPAFVLYEKEVTADSL